MNTDTQTQQTPRITQVIHDNDALIARCNESTSERNRAQAHADKLAEALSMATATIERLQRHAPGSAVGTLDVCNAALAAYEAAQ